MKRKTSSALVEVRTVASRAETAIDTIRRIPGWRATAIKDGLKYQERDGPGTHDDMVSLTGFYAKYAEDPEEPEMIAALGQVLALLERWR